MEHISSCSLIVSMQIKYLPLACVTSRKMITSPTFKGVDSRSSTAPKSSVKMSVSTDNPLSLLALPGLDLVPSWGREGGVREMVGESRCGDLGLEEVPGGGTVSKLVVRVAAAPPRGLWDDMSWGGCWTGGGERGGRDGGVSGREEGRGRLRQGGWQVAGREERGWEEGWGFTKEPQREADRLGVRRHSNKTGEGEGTTSHDRRANGNAVLVGVWQSGANVPGQLQRRRVFGGPD